MHSGRRIPDAAHGIALAVNTLRVEVITSFPKLWGLGPEWQELETASATDLPFQTWEWSTGWWSHLHDDGVGVRDSLRVCVVRTATGKMVGVAPLMITERPSVGPIRLSVLQFIGADPNITELRSMLCLPTFEEACYTTVQDHLASSIEGWDWITWEGVPSDIRGGAGFVDRLGSVDEMSAFVLDLAPTWEEFRGKLGRNIKQSLRKCYNTLKRDGLTCELRVLAQLEEIDSGLRQFFGLHAARANLEGTVDHPDVFSQPRSRHFLVEVCQRLAKRRVARIFQLWVDDKLVATRVGFVMADTLFLYYSGWDPNYARYSVMTTLLAEIIQYAIADGLKYVHLSTGADVSKTRWGAREIRFLSGRQLSPGGRARAFHFMYERVKRARSSSGFARTFIPAFAIRGSRSSAAPQRERVAARGLRLGALVGSVAALLTLDLLDGRLDGIANLFPTMLG